MELSRSEKRIINFALSKHAGELIARNQKIRTLKTFNQITETAFNSTSELKIEYEQNDRDIETIKNLMQKENRLTFI